MSHDALNPRPMSETDILDRLQAAHRRIRELEGKLEIATKGLRELIIGDDHTPGSCRDCDCQCERVIPVLEAIKDHAILTP